MARILPDTKFYVPRPRESLVSRPRLTAALSRAVRAKLTLISAPPGFGKTTLLADVAGGTPIRMIESRRGCPSTRPTTSPGSFWAAVATAIHRAVPDAGATISMLQEAQPPPIETVVTTLVNELGAVGSDIVLVLDDYHVIETAEIHDQVAFLLEHLPPSVHVVITTRADPPFPLARLRAQGQLVEVRAADLRFTRDETATYLESTRPAWTWTPARSPRSRSGPKVGSPRSSWPPCRCRAGTMSTSFIAGFTGDDRFVVDYLVEEVLQRQPDDVRRFLQWTSILDRLTGALCDAVTGQDGGQATLEVLDRRNLFVIPLDARREWYRYHHLFADVLRASLLREEPDRVLDLHRRASRWYEQHGERSDAIRHALAGEDFERAADMIEPAIPSLRQARQEATMRRWFELLPDELFQVRPVLSVGYVGALMANGEFSDVEVLLRGAERWLEPPSDARWGAVGTARGDGRGGRSRVPAAAERGRPLSSCPGTDERRSRAHRGVRRAGPRPRR